MSDLPRGDIWRLIDRDSDSQHYQYNFKFDFTFFESEEIKVVVKEYIWSNYRTGNRTPRGLRESLWNLKSFDAFCRENALYSLRNLDNGLADDYRSYLCTRLSTVTGKPLSYSFQRSCFTTLKSVVSWCRVFLADAVPQKQVFTGSEYRQTHSGLKIDFIPDDILVTVNTALENEENLYLKYGIIILECTGMRVSDLLLLKTNCISEHPISGDTISWFDHKNRKSRDNMPIPRECKGAVEALLKHTDAIRTKAEGVEKDHLFIYAPRIGRHKKPIVTVSRQVFTKWCSDFSKKHNIRDSGGNVYPITSHMFRRTLATDMLSKGTNIKVIQEALGHSSPATTRKYYADVKDAERTEMFLKIGVLGNIKQIGYVEIPDQAELKWFQENCTSKARLSDGYCTLPVQDGKPCGHFLSRQKCYLCSRYITTLEDLDAHKLHLAELEELLDSNNYGAHFAAHIIPTTLALKEIIRRLEELRNEQ